MSAPKKGLRRRKDPQFEFSVLLEPLADEDLDTLAERLYTAGCDDATLAVRNGWPLLTFCRKSDSLESAVLSALGQLRSMGLKPLRVDHCDLVTQAEIARRIGRSRQIVSQYIKGQRGPGGFPPPACDFGNCGGLLWYWCEVANWLHEHNLLPEEKREEALFLDAVNMKLHAKWLEKAQPELVNRIELQLQRAKP